MVGSHTECNGYEGLPEAPILVVALNPKVQGGNPRDVLGFPKNGHAHNTC